VCGVAGGSHESPAVAGALGVALKAIAHRGPDDSGTYIDGQVFLGMTRLAIIDIAGGHQPMTSPDGSLTVVFNGEIYNYRELHRNLAAKGHVFRTDSDTEVLLHLYEDLGTDFVDPMRGMFALAIYDRRDVSLHLARDRFGKKPLYYSQTPRGLVFASELKALKPLAKAAGDTWTIDDQAIYDYLSLAVVPQPRTIYRKVSSVPAASVLTFKDRKTSVRRYWRPEFSPKLDVSYAEAQRLSRESIAEAVGLRLRSDVPLGVFLSGGVDSSVVAYEAAKLTGSDLQTFTISTPGALDEAPVAARTAAALGIRNTVLPLQINALDGLQEVIGHYDQPYADSSAIPSLQISRLARQHVTVVLNGDGGDEVFGGYRRYVAAYNASRFDQLPRSVSSHLSSALGRFNSSRRGPLGFVSRFARGLSLDAPERYLAWTLDMMRESDKRKCWRGAPSTPTEVLISSRSRSELSALDQQMATDIELNLLSDLLVKMDIASMAHSLEARSPFLDHRVAELAWRLPDRHKIKRGTPKSVLRDAYRGRLSDEVIRGAKRGFEIPLRSWLENDLRSILLETVGSRTALVRSYLDGEIIDDLVEQRSMTERNWAYIVYALLVLELWLQRERSGSQPVHGCASAPRASTR